MENLAKITTLNYCDSFCQCISLSFRERKKKKMQFTSLGLSVLGETVPSVLSTALSCIIQDLGHSFSQYRPPTWQITYIYCINCCVVQECPTLRTAITAHL